MLELFVIRFAADKGQEPKVVLITAEIHERWCMAEPPQGYAVFEELHRFDIDSTADETIEALKWESNPEEKP